MRGAVYGVANEGWPFVLALVAAVLVLLFASTPIFSIVPAALLPIAILKFRDPSRDVPADPLGVLSPVDGVVLRVEQHNDESLLCLRVNAFGAYLLRSPTEGNVQESGPAHGGHGMRLRTDEGEEVLLRLYGPRWLPAAASVDYGQRLGQGQRCGVVRATRVAEVWLPADATLSVAAGDKVVAGETVLARFTANGA